MPEAAVEDQRFETNQTVLAAYLVFCGHTIDETVWENDMCTFFFERGPSLAGDYAAFLEGKARVEPVSFSGAYGQVMQRVKQERPQRPRLRRTK